MNKSNVLNLCFQANPTIHPYYIFLFVSFQPDSTVEPFFDTLVREGQVENIFAMQLCGSNPMNNTKAAASPHPNDAEVTGTLVGIIVYDLELLGPLQLIPSLLLPPASEIGAAWFI